MIIIIIHYRLDHRGSLDYANLWTIRERKDSPVWWYATWRILTSCVEIVYCWAWVRIITKIGNFCYEFAPKGYIPLSDFYKIWHGAGSPRFAPSRQILPFWLSKCGLTAQKIAKNANLWYTFAPKGYIPLGRFLHNFAWGREPQDRTVIRNFTVLTLKLWPCGTKNRQKMVIFGKNLPLEKSSGGR